CFMKRLSLLIMISLVLFAVESYSLSRRMVLLEEVTSANCGACVSANNAVYPWVTANLNNYVIPVIYHSGNGMSEPMYDINPQMLGSRIWGTYVSGTLGTPAFWVNGTKVSSSAVPTEYAKYAGTDSPISMYVVETRNETTMDVDVFVDSDEAITGQSTGLSIIVIETPLHFTNAGSNGEKDFPWVARAMFPSPAPTQSFLVNIPKGESRTYRVTGIPYNAQWDKTKIYCVAFIQNYASPTKEILQAAVTLPANQVKPKITTSANTIDFGICSTKVIKTVEISNTGIKDLVITDISIGGTDKTYFKLLSDTKTATLARGQKISVDVEFWPDKDYLYSAMMVIKSNGNDGKDKSVMFNGRGFNIQKFAEVTTSSDLLDFGNVSDNKDMKFEITNTGNADLTITELKINGDADNSFSASVGNNDPIPSGSKAEITVTFKPKANMDYTADLVIISNAINQKIISLTGTGKGIVSMPVATLSASTIDFGKISTNKTETIELSNTGNANLQILDYSIKNDADKVFKIKTSSFPTLKPGDKLNIDISFTPKENKTYTGSVVLETNVAANQGMVTIQLAGTGENVVSVNDQIFVDGSSLSIEATPNPFISSINIKYTLVSQLPQQVSMKIFDAKGSEVASLLNGTITGSGSLTFDGTGISAGQYFLVVKLGDSTKSIPLVYIP
ncbi:MAG: hypothetical protein QG635_1205, partial [Bacteroidota bacterium]|nr:hypothetical protein [Bacteroidota bacterium]